MGKRWVWWAVLFGLLVAGLQVWLLSAILSKPGADGKTGWDAVSSVYQPVERDPAVSIAELISVKTTASNCEVAVSPTAPAVVIWPGVGHAIALKFRAIAPTGTTPSGYHFVAYALAADTPSTVSYDNVMWRIEDDEVILPVEITFSATLGSPQDYPNGQTFYLSLFGLYDALVETIAFTVIADADTLPTFTASTSYKCNEGGLGVAEWTVSALVYNQPTSWSYELYDAPDATGSRIYAGSVNSPPNPPECRASMKVTGIPSYPFGPESIKLIATNANGTAETVVNLFPPVPKYARISADPTGILEGQDTTLNWSVGARTSSAEIDNGIGFVYSAVTSTETSGSVTVSPTETTTYTITAYGGCSEITASVKVYVQAVPRPGMASLTWEAQAGIGSKKVARFDEPAVLNWTAVDPTRTPRTARVLCRASVLEDVRTEKTARVLARASVRGNMTTRVLCRATSRKPVSVRVLARARSLYPDRHHVMARNVATGVVSEWGVVDHGEFPLTLSDVAISPGTYMVWLEREGVFWKNARLGSETKIVIADGQAPVTHSLPLASDLAASISLGLTTLTWTASTPITDFGVVWGLWFDDTASIDTSGNPDYSFMADIGQEEFEYTVMQTASEYVAVAAIGTDKTRGTSTELYLPWSTSAPSSPPNQVALS